MLYYKTKMQPMFYNSIKITIKTKKYSGNSKDCTLRNN